VSALADEIRAAVREVLRDELPKLLAEARPQQQGAALVGVTEAARRLGLAVGTVYKMAARLEVPSHKIKGRLLFRAADIEEYTTARRRSPERVAELAEEALAPK
jgi:excisionase family DNA binding protein